MRDSEAQKHSKVVFCVFVFDYNNFIASVLFLYNFLIIFINQSRYHLATILYTTIPFPYTLHPMMHLQSVLFCLCFGYGTETVCPRITAYGERDMLRKKISHFLGREPVRLWRLPINEEEIWIFLMDGRRLFSCAAVLQFVEDAVADVVIHFSPQPLACQKAVVILIEWRIQVPKVNKWSFHNYTI